MIQEVFKEVHENPIPQLLSLREASYILDFPNSNDLKLWTKIKKGNVKVRVKISYECLGK